MTLTDYYEKLPKLVAPKTDFVRRVATRCGVETGTVRFWIKGRSKPCNPEHLSILSEETGIPAEDLFQK
jgi:hypothetical protein